ncbi:MAG: hypothetical protein K2N47_00645, partial [Clostridia bacterium]|nr:hypothetical protein [Clostridia bacterium]
MEFSEIEKKLVEESKTYTPNVYGNIVAEAQAEGLLTASAPAVGGSAVGSSVGGSVGSNAAVKMGALGLKKLVSIIVSAVLAVAIAVTSITVSVLNSNGGAGGNSADGSGTEQTGGNEEGGSGSDGDGETGGNGDGDGETGGKGDDETKITSYVGLTYKLYGAVHAWPMPSPDASEQEKQEYNMLIGAYMETLAEGTITFTSENSFTLTTRSYGTYTGTMEQEGDRELKLDVKHMEHIFHPDENERYAYVQFRYNFGTEEINYDYIDVMVTP